MEKEQRRELAGGRRFLLPDLTRGTTRRTIDD